jgi:ABC-type xylose transport system permease subunit
MYQIALTLHSWVRWIVLLAALFAVITAVRGARAGVWPASGKVPAFLALMIAADVQLLLGLTLWATSPIVASARQAMGAAMKSPVQRWWTVEHGFAALFGIVVVHVGFAMAKREGDAIARFKRAAWTFGFALICFLVANPWPWREIGRGWFRF